MSAIDEEALRWVARQEAAPLDEVDSQGFAAWYAESPRHQGAHLRAQAIWHSLERGAIQKNLVPLESQPEQAGRVGESVVAVPDEVVSKRLNRRHILTVGVGIAASMAGALIWARYAPGSVLKTTTGEFRKVPLQDRSIANLNSASHVEVSMTSTLRRVVLLEGEAWFEVAKDPGKPFVVEAGDIRVQAIGTAFSVRRHPNGADVLVTEGMVEAWSQTGNGVRQAIAAGQEAFVPEGATTIRVSGSLQEVERKLAWRDGRIVLNNETLAEAVADFNRYNTLKIIIADPAINDVRLVGQYRIDQPEYFADSLHGLLDVPVSVTQSGIILGVSPTQAGVGPKI